MACRARRRIATVHFGSPLEKPVFETNYLRWTQAWLRDIAASCDILIAVSEHMRCLLTSRHEIAGERVVTIPLGIDSQFFDEPGDAPRTVQRPYLLFVGRLSWIKNVEAVCGAFARLAKRHKDLDLVLLGWQDISPSTIQGWLGRSGAAQRLHIVPPVPPESAELVRWYRGASVFVFPSLSEGWTSPPLEAMACGVPVVTSNVSSLPETVGNAALQVNPHDQEALADAVERLLLDAALRREMIEPRPRTRPGVHLGENGSEDNRRLSALGGHEFTSKKPALCQRSRGRSDRAPRRNDRYGRGQGPALRGEFSRCGAGLDRGSKAAPVSLSLESPSMSLHVAIDASSAMLESNSGTKRYVSSLLPALVEADPSIQITAWMGYWSAVHSEGAPIWGKAGIRSRSPPPAADDRGCVGKWVHECRDVSARGEHFP